MREVIVAPILKGLDQKNQVFDTCSWFQFNNLGLALGISLKVCTSVAKKVKIKSQAFLEAKSYVCRIHRRKPDREVFCLTQF